MDDMAGPGRIQEDNDRHRPTLTVHDVSLALSAAGVPRFERQIKHYCETGFLDAKKVPGPKMVRRPAWIGFWALDAKRLMPDDGHFCGLVVSRHEGPVCLQAVEIRRECRHEPWK